MEGAEAAEAAEGNCEIANLKEINPCRFRPIRVIRDKVVQPGPRPILSAHSASFIPLRELLKQQAAGTVYVLARRTGGPFTQQPCRG